VIITNRLCDDVHLVQIGIYVGLSVGHGDRLVLSEVGLGDNANYPNAHPFSKSLHLASINHSN